MALAAISSARLVPPPLAGAGGDSRPRPRPALSASLASPAAPTTTSNHRSSSSGLLAIPTALSNLVHLKTDKKKDSDDDVGELPLAVPGGPTSSPKENISALRDELYAGGDWSPLLEPLHPWLRREIVKYGELAQATYDAFDFNPWSPYCGSCLYGKQRLFEKLRLAHHGYSVTDYVYAMSHVALPRWLERSLHADTWSRDSNWMGFVAVADDAEAARIGSRNIVVAWRGTIAPAEWFEECTHPSLEPVRRGDHAADARVERGFQSIYTSKSVRTRYNKRSASEQAVAAIRTLVERYRSRGEHVSLTVTGHSLGGALALLNAYEAASEFPGLPVNVVSFAAPRVGNDGFRSALAGAGVKVLRAVVKQDVVPKLPGVFFNGVYEHVGDELGLDMRSSPYVKRPRVGADIVGAHNLELYLHLVDGYRSAGEQWRRDAKRDVALVNKASAMLREELHVPAMWCRPANGGLVCDANGRWVRAKREEEDIPSPDSGATAAAGSFN